MKLNYHLIVSFILLSGIFGSAQGQDIQILPPVTVTSSSNVTQKVSQSFKGFFKDAAEAKWFKLDKNYLVKFMMNDQKNTALFKKNGNLIYHISYGYEKHLPEDVKMIVKTGYQSMHITSAIKVEQGSRNIWVINLESDTRLILVRVEDGEMEEVGNYENAGVTEN